ncbi:MAG: RnfABCDGE type electron transport complex subunit D [Bacteroidales bacterium]|nr:RnfABCDGE type electron transport complex subunit D [Bacteroidales bacterium]NLK81811.1 RnfABCDGE type electron transport complex subunit D [Bacteroidales bacterium]
MNSVKKFTVSPSPHIHSGESVQKIMYGVLYALIPAFLVSVYAFGFDALLITFTAVVSCVLFEWLIQRYVLRGKNTILDGSAVITGVLLAFNVPSSLPLWMIVVGSLVAIGVAKMSFGGLGKNPFNPALVGRVFLLMSFPAHMTQWPKPMMGKFFADAVTGPTPLAVIKEGIAKGNSMTEIMAEFPNISDLLLGFIGGSIGEISAIAIIIGGIYMLYKKIITWHIPVSILATIALFSAVLHLVDMNVYISPLYHILTGGVLLGAVFMATDMVTSPMTNKGMLLYGFGIGVITIAIRTFGAYPEGISFAILIMNACVPLINKSFRPKMFGEKK